MRLYTSELVKKYKARTVVDHVSIDVNQGEIVGLLGPNGAGKTTTFYMIVGLIKPNEGRIFLEDDEGKVAELTKEPVYKRAQMGVGYLAQEASVFRRLSVEDNIRAVLEMTDFSKEYQNERVESLIEEFRLQKVRKSLGIQLSGGERRRTEIARAVRPCPRRTRISAPPRRARPPGTPLDAGADPYDPRSYDKYTQRTYSPDAMYDQVLEFVNANKERPFFLMWTTPIPHSPMQAPDADVQYYVRKFGDEQPIEGKGYFPSRWPRATYAAMITYFDRQIGGLVAELKRLGIWENTVIVITSDNGPASNSCSSSEWFDSAHPFRSGKGWGKSSLREGGIRMPFIVAWGGKLRPQVSDHVGYFPDVMPTLCELAGVEPPATDGISFLPALEGRRQPQHEYLYWEFPGSKGWVAVRWGEWKGLLRRVKEGNDRFELFNLSDDPREEHDLAAQHPEIIDRMWQFVSASHTEPANPKFRMEVGRK